MKKIISLLVACAMLFAFLAACDSEPNPEISRKDPNAAFPTPYMDEKEQTAGDTIPFDFQYSHLEEGIVIERYIGSETIVEIPAQIGGVAVTRIDEDAFRECTALEDVVIPDSVTSIGAYAFNGTAIYNTEDCWTNGVLYIGNWLIEAKESISGDYAVASGTAGIADAAFSNCSALTSVTIPDSVRSIGVSAFWGCSSLTNVTLPNDMTKIEVSMFYECSSLTNVVLPDNVTTIGEYAFHGCGNLTDITIPEGLTSIGDYAFCYDGLKSVTFPESVTSIGEDGFFGCDNLADITILNGDVSIGRCAFSDCSSLTSVTLPDGITEITLGLFEGCSGLTDIVIPESVTSIDDRAFYGCNYLRGVYFTGNAPALGENVFKMWDDEESTDIDLPGLTLYYIEGKTGWTNPNWNSYSTTTWIPAN